MGNLQLTFLNTKFHIDVKINVAQIIYALAFLLAIILRYCCK
jgi:hypothetical protein